tara:strand:+ start:1118 stop:2122 length:1005 start_codon:yes stop_codon:yes gene_type:complete
MRFLVTGAAGFIGFHVTKKLHDEGHKVVGIDNLNDYYDVSLKKSRLQHLEKLEKFSFFKLDISNKDSVNKIFEEGSFDRVIHLAAQAGVRYSIENPYAYIDSNIMGFMTILEACRDHDINHLVYASSSSVYGLNKNLPFKVTDNVDNPISLYAASKKANELMAHTYSHLYSIPTTGLRFFTVYGPWGRPDMALFKFTKAMISGQPIDIYNNGNLSRDFTFVDDIVEGIYRIQNVVPCKSIFDDLTINEDDISAPYSLYNIGNGSPVKLTDFIETIEKKLKIKASKNYLPMQPGDVYKTFADTELLFDVVNYKPSVDIDEGISKFVSWYLDYYKI